MEKQKSAEEILDCKVHGPKGASEDLLTLIGYIWAEGNQKRVFPSSHMQDLSTHFINKHILSLPRLEENDYEHIENKYQTIHPVNER